MVNTILQENFERDYLRKSKTRVPHLYWRVSLTEVVSAMGMCISFFFSLNSAIYLPCRHRIIVHVQVSGLP